MFVAWLSVTDGTFGGAPRLVLSGSAPSFSRSTRFKAQYTASPPRALAERQEWRIERSTDGWRTGRPPKPASLRILQGNPGKRKMFQSRNSCATGRGLHRRDLSEGARKVWDTLADELIAARLLLPRYCLAFAQFCEAFSAWRRAADLVAVGTIIQRGDVLISNPASQE